MNGKTLDNLPESDPLYQYLTDIILLQSGSITAHPQFAVQNSVASENVYLYHEIHSNTKFIGKYYPDGKNGNLSKGEVEFRNLLHLRSLGFDTSPHYVVKPLGFNAEIGNLLLMEFLEGDSLGSIIDNGVHHGKERRLYRKLTSLAHFLAKIHNNTAEKEHVDFGEMRRYMLSLIGVLKNKRGLLLEDEHEFVHLLDTWQARDYMWQDKRVLVHGDVTPANFLFHHGPDVMAIDLERMQWADRVFDLGRMCGELTHSFYQGTDHPEKAEPFIGHFLWEYSCHFPDRETTFASITRRVPFYMGMTLLRIARNWWISPDYREKLLDRAKQILRTKP